MLKAGPRRCGLRSRDRVEPEGLGEEARCARVFVRTWRVRVRAMQRGARQAYRDRPDGARCTRGSRG